MIRRMELRDLSECVEIHMASFPGFFLSSLGRSFLTILYRGYVTDRDGIALVYVDPGTNKAVATAVGVARPSQFYWRQLLWHGHQYALAALPAVLRSPRIVTRLLRAIAKPAVVSKERDSAEWSSMAVVPAFRRCGIAGQLTEAMKDEARKRGAAYLYGWTDEVGNDPINRHHKKAGAHYIKQFRTPEGRVMNIIRYSL